MIVGAVQSDPFGRLNAGAAFIVRGGPSHTDIDLASPGAGVTRIAGVGSSEYAGFSVSGAGDLDDDGYDDVVLSSPYATGDGGAQSGSAWVVRGRATPVDVDLAAPGATEAFRIDGAAADDYAGNSVAGAGDVDGDGYDDVLVGAPQADPNGRSRSGSTYLVRGGATLADVDLASPGPAAIRIDGEATNDFSGNSVAGAGDIDGDRAPDILIGAQGADNNGRSGSGSAYVVDGVPPPPDPTPDPGPGPAPDPAPSPGGGTPDPGPAPATPAPGPARSVPVAEEAPFVTRVGAPAARSRTAEPAGTTRERLLLAVPGRYTVILLDARGRRIVLDRPSRVAGRRLGRQMTAPVVRTTAARVLDLSIVPRAGSRRAAAIRVILRGTDGTLRSQDLPLSPRSTGGSRSAG